MTLYTRHECPRCQGRRTLNYGLDAVVLKPCHECEGRGEIYRPAPAERMGDEKPGPWVIRKDGYFYRANAQGYTSRLSEAWLFSEIEARFHENRDPMHRVTAHPASEFAASTTTREEPPKSILEAVERVLDEESAWIARPNHEVAKRIALVAGIVWQMHAEKAAADALEAARAEVERLRAALEKRDSDMAAIGGCGDGDCVVVKPVGQHTNGGCRCMRDLVKSQRFAYAANQFARSAREALAALAPAEGKETGEPVARRPETWDVEATAETIARSLSKTKGGRFHEATYVSAKAGATEAFRTVLATLSDPAALAPADGEGDYESGWLCELTNNHRPVWWCLDVDEEEPGWQPDSTKALRFCRKQDAEAYIRDAGWTDVVATEHEWVPAPTTTRED